MSQKKPSDRERYKESVRRILKALYIDHPPVESPVNRRTKEKKERNKKIRSRYEDGDTLKTLSEEFGISIARVHEIIRSEQKKDEHS